MNPAVVKKAYTPIASPDRWPADRAISDRLATDRALCPSPRVSKTSRNRSSGKASDSENCTHAAPPIRLINRTTAPRAMVFGDWDGDSDTGRPLAAPSGNAKPRRVTR